MGTQNFFSKNLTVPKVVAQCRKYPIPYLNTLSRTIPYAYTLPNAIAYLNTCIPILIHAYLNTLSRLHILIHCRLGSQSKSNTRETSANNQNRTPSATNQNREPSTLGSQSESSITSPESSVNQNRALRQPSRHYVTRELSDRVEDPSRLSARYSLS